jgi:molybdate transport system substrate-binding protein
MPRFPRRLVVLLACTVLVVACGDDEPARPASSGSGSASSTTRPPLAGSLTVFAAASLTESFDALERALSSKAPDLSLTLSFAGSQALVQQIRQGAPADVFGSADERNMQQLVDAGLVEPPQVFAHNELEIVVAPGNPKGVKGLADLARSDLLVVLEDPSVPAGNYSQQALRKAGVRVVPKSLELDVKATLAKVTSGEADAAIVYASDVQAAGGTAAGVEIPDAQNVVATYPIAVVKASSHRAAAEAFVVEVVSGAGQDVLRSHGFLPA